MSNSVTNTLQNLHALPAIATLFFALTVQPTRAALPGTAVDLSILVVTAQTNDYSLESIREALEFIGTPYHVHVATENPGSLISDTLRSGTRGFYQGVILTSDSLAYTPDGGNTWLSALTPAEWARLEQYEIDFGARRLNWYANPGPNQGLNWPTGAIDTTGNPIDAQWSAEGAGNFAYLNTRNTYPIENVWVYLSTPLDANTQVWLSDNNGNALLAQKTFPNGRELLTKTFDSATWQMNSSVLYHGLINWVTKGLFVGDRHTYVMAQIDDVFLADDIYTGGEYRQDANDWQAVINWQNTFRQRLSGANFRFDMAFNGSGTEGQYNPDDLTPLAQATEAEFKWISHTWSHPYLTQMTYAQSMPEIVQNNQKAVELGLTTYSVKNMVTPNITGLENPAFLNAAYDAGIRYLVTDTSIPAHRAPSPNAGIPNWYVPGILMIPRHANNLFYNVSTPAQWEAEYNFLFGSYWGRDLTYAEILEEQSDLLLRPLLKGDVSPQMFHQPNLRDYDGTGSTLLGDLLTRVADKYEYYYNFPFVSPTQDKLGETVQARMDYNNSGVLATRNGDNSLTVTVTTAATIPVTGLKTPSAEFYAGQWITHLNLSAGEVVTLIPDGNGGYTIPNVPDTNPNVTIDGNFAEWAAIASVGAGLDFANIDNIAGNELDLTALKVTHSDSHLNILYQNENPITLTWAYTLYLDTDRNPGSGFNVWAIGADYMLQGSALYRYTGTGTDWSWAFVETAVNAINGNGAELAITRAGLGNPDSINYLFYGENAAFGGTDFELVPTSADHLRYDLVAPTAGGIQVDGNLADWTGPALATDADDVAGANNPLDLRELRLDNDADNYYFAYVNEGPLTLNWGSTLYLDTDANLTTGFGYWSTGADYMVQGADVYRYAGTGADWNWTWVGPIDQVANGGTVEASFPKSFLGTGVTTINLIFHGENAAFGGTAVDTVPDDPNTPLTYSVK